MAFNKIEMVEIRNGRNPLVYAYQAKSFALRPWLEPQMVSTSVTSQGSKFCPMTTAGTSDCFNIGGFSRQWGICCITQEDGQQVPQYFGTGGLQHGSQWGRLLGKGHCSPAAARDTDWVAYRSPQRMWCRSCHHEYTPQTSKERRREVSPR